MSYSDSPVTPYVFPAVNFGSTSAQSIKGPAGKKGRLVDIHVSCTTLFTAVTTAAFVDVGTAADIDYNAHFSLGTLAATDSILLTGSTGSLSALIEDDIAADTQVEVTFTAPTGGTPAGVGTVTVYIQWAD